MAFSVSTVENDILRTGAAEYIDLAGLASRYPDGGIATPERDLLRSEAKEETDYVLSGCLSGLTSSHHDVLVMRYWHDLTFAEIGRVMGVGESAARKLHDRAKRCLSISLDVCGYSAADLPS